MDDHRLGQIHGGGVALHDAVDDRAGLAVAHRGGPFGDGGAGLLKVVLERGDLVRVGQCREGLLQPLGVEDDHQPVDAADEQLLEARALHMLAGAQGQRLREHDRLDVLQLRLPVVLLEVPRLGGLVAALGGLLLVKIEEHLGGVEPQQRDVARHALHRLGVAVLVLMEQLQAAVQRQGLEPIVIGFVLAGLGLGGGDELGDLRRGEQAARVLGEAIRLDGAGQGLDKVVGGQLLVDLGDLAVVVGFGLGVAVARVLLMEVDVLAQGGEGGVVGLLDEGLGGLQGVVDLAVAGELPDAAGDIGHAGGLDGFGRRGGLGRRRGRGREGGQGQGGDEGEGRPA